MTSPLQDVAGWPVDRLAGHLDVRTPNWGKNAQFAASVADFGSLLLVGGEGVAIGSDAQLPAAQKLGITAIAVIVLRRLFDQERHLCSRSARLNLGHPLIAFTNRIVLSISVFPSRRQQQGGEE
jgi:hypothetical protein